MSGWRSGLRSPERTHRGADENCPHRSPRWTCTPPAQTFGGEARVGAWSAIGLLGHTNTAGRGRVACGDGPWVQSAKEGCVEGVGEGGLRFNGHGLRRTGKHGLRTGVAHRGPRLHQARRGRCEALRDTFSAFGYDQVYQALIGVGSAIGLRWGRRTRLAKASSAVVVSKRVQRQRRQRWREL